MAAGGQGFLHAGHMRERALIHRATGLIVVAWAPPVLSVEPALGVPDPSPDHLAAFVG